MGIFFCFLNMVGFWVCEKHLETVILELLLALAATRVDISRLVQ